MKKGLFALLLCLALCVCVCTATAEGELPNYWRTFQIPDVFVRTSSNQSLTVAIPQDDQVKESIAGSVFSLSLWKDEVQPSLIEEYSTRCQSGQSAQFNLAGKDEGVYFIRSRRFENSDATAPIEQIDCYFALTDGETAEPVLIMNSNEVRYGSGEAVVGVYAQGAVSTYIRFGTDDLRGQDGDQFLTGASFSEAGSVNVQGFATYSDGTTKTVSKTLTVRQPEGSIGIFEPTIMAGGEPVDAVIVGKKSIEINVPIVSNQADILAADSEVFYQVYFRDITIGWDEDPLKVVYMRTRSNQQLDGTSKDIYNTDGQTVMIPADQLNESGIYYYWISAWAEGYGRKTVEGSFMIQKPVGETAHTVSMSINGSQEPEVYPAFGQEFEVQISFGPEGAEWPDRVYFHYDGGGEMMDSNREEWEDWQNQGAITLHWYAPESSWGRVASATAIYHEGEDDEEIVYSNIVKVYGSEPAKTLRAPEFELLSAAVQRGDYLTVQVMPQDDAVDGVWAYVEPKDYSNWYGTYDGTRVEGEEGQDGYWEIAVPTIGLQPDSYMLTVGNWAEGMADGCNTGVFIVTEPAENIGDVAFRASKTEITTMEEVTFSAWAEGADYIEIRFRDGDSTESPEYDWQDNAEYDRDHSHFDARYGYEQSGEYNAQLVVHYATNDENHPMPNGAPVDEDGSCWQYIYPTPIVIHVSAEGDVGAISISPSFAIHPAGEDLDLHISTTAAEGGVLAERIGLELRRIDHDWEWIDYWEHEANENGEADITLPQDLFEDGGMYQIRVDGKKKGYNVNRREIRFLVKAENELTQSLTVTVDGSNASEMNLRSFQDVYVEVDYPANNRPTVIRILNGDEWEYWWGDDSFDREWGFGDGEVLIYAEASWDDTDFDALDANNWQIETDEGLREFDWNQDVEWTATSNTIMLHVSSPYGEMQQPNVSVGNTELAWGEDLILDLTDETPMATNVEGTVIPVPEGWYYGNISVKHGEGNDIRWEHVNHDYNYPLRYGVNHIPTYNLEGGCTYRFEYGADAEGFRGNGSEIVFTLGEKPDESGEAISFFRINGQTGDISTLTEVEMTLSGYLSGAEWYDVEITKADDEDWYDNRSEGHGMLYDRWQASEEGTYTLTAYGCGHLTDAQGDPITDDGGNDEWRTEIGTIHVTATAPNGNMGPVNADVPDMVYVGDKLSITFHEITGAETYSYWIHRAGDNEWLAGDNRHSPGTLTINTRRLESGIYRVELDAWGSGYNSSHNSLHFALLDRNDTDHSETEGAYYFTISTDSVETEVGVHIIAYVPGAENTMLYCSRFNAEQNEYGELEEIASEMGPGVETWFGSCDPGKYGIYLRWEADGWSEPVLVTSLQITNPHGNLAVPSIIINGSETGYAVQANAENPQDPQAPHTVTITIPEVDNVESYFIQMGPANEGWHFYEKGHHVSELEDNQLQLTITDENIEPGRMYEVFCEVHAQGYAGASTRRSFLLQGNQAKTVTLSVEEGEYWTAMPVQVHAEAARATAIRIHMNNEWRYYRGNEVDDRFTIWDQDTLFYAFATENQLPEDDDFNWDELDLNWTMQSNPIYIYAETEGPTQVPTMNVPEAVTRGEWLVFTINDDGDARQFDARIRDEDGNEMEFRRFWATGEYVLPTANLEAGRNYSIRLSCVQDYHMWNEGEEYWFHVNAPATNQAIFRLDKTDVYPGEAFIPTIYAPGAVQVKITLGGGIWLECDGEYGTNNADWEWWLDDEGEHLFEAYALYEGDTEWTPINTVLVRVAFLGKLTMDRSGFPPYLTADSTNVKLNFSLPENAEGMNIGVFEDWDDDEGYHRNEISEIRDAKEDLEITIPATNLISGHRIIVDYHAYAIGYEGDGGSVNIPIIAAAGSGARMVIEEGYLNPETGNALVDSDIRFLVEADEGYTLSAVRVFNGYDFWNPDYRDEHPEWFPEGKYEFVVNHHDIDRVYTVYAEVQLAGSEEWITTNVISFGLDMIDEVGAYDFTDLSDITVQRGQNFTVTFTEAAHANRYWADMFDEERSYNPATVYEGRSVTIATANLPAGVYELWGRAGGDDGWRWTESTHFVRVTVTEGQVPASGILLTFNKNEVDTLEMFTISVYAPGAERVKLCHQEENNIWVDDEGDSWTSSRWLTDGNGEQTFYAFAMFNGAWSDPVIGHINLIAEGDAPAANVTVSATAVEPDETIQVHVALPEGAVQFAIAASLERGKILDGEDNYTDVLNYGVYDYDRDFIIRTTEARNGDVVWLTVWTYARGTNCCATTVRILVTAQPNLGQVTFRTPANLTEIGEEAFEGIAAKVVQISDHVTTIGHRAFAGSQIEQIVIPDSVTQIEGNPFEGCRNVMVFCGGNSYAKTWADEHDETIAVVIP